MHCSASRFLSCWFFLLTIFSAFSQTATLPASHEGKWVDSVLNELSLDERIGQLFMVTTYSNQKESDYSYIERLIRQQHLGGLIFMQGDPLNQIRLINRYQARSRVPLLISQDAEWGLGMRLKQTRSYPKNMTLGAVRDDSLLYKMGYLMGMELKRTGVQVNFAPVVDVNNNANNPVINYRSFGENRYKVARKGIMLTKGMQDVGVLACAKHFPGHGDTDTDSHYGLPLIPHSLERLDSLELYPFSKMAAAGVEAMMVAHLYIPALDSTPDLASSLSSNIIQKLLREKLGYNGLIFTDALNMRGVTQYHQPGEVSYKALLAGNDMLLSPNNVPRAAQMIRQAVLEGILSEADIEARVRRILRAKFRSGLAYRRPLSTKNLQKDLWSEEARVLVKQLYESALTLAKNDKQLLPLDRLEQKRIAYIQIGGASGNSFEKNLRKYGSVTPFYLRKGFSNAEKQRLLDQLKTFNTLIIGIRGMNSRASSNYGITPNIELFCRELAQLGKQSVLTLFGNPYALKSFGDQQAILVAYEDADEAGRAAAAAIFGGIKVEGRLPVTASPQFPKGTGHITHRLTRFGFAFPEEKGMDSKVLGKIDSIANHYIARQAMPGCQILVLRDREIVYEKAFGRTQYGGRGEKIDPYLHTYDLASITKVAATTLSVMDLIDKRKIKLDVPISHYLSDLKGTDKAKLTVRRLLQHNAGLPSWAPLYTETFSDPGKRKLDARFFSYQRSRSHANQIAPLLFSTAQLKSWTWEQIKQIEVRNTRAVRYSDIGMIILGRIVEKVAGMSLEQYTQTHFYRKMGMNQTLFNPAQSGKEKFCPPTERDTYWRKAVIQGFVHDPTAAMLEGVSGHAGLFSNIYDLAKLMLMVKEGGKYGGEAYLSPQTIETFTRKQLSYSRKGLGWDKPEGRPNRSTPVSDYTSLKTYGHTGFTGTCVWVDPQYDLVYIFLSNRTYPYANQYKLLIRENVRIVIMDQIYKSIFAFEQPKS